MPPKNSLRSFASVRTALMRCGFRSMSRRNAASGAVSGIHNPPPVSKPTSVCVRTTRTSLYAVSRPKILCRPESQFVSGCCMRPRAGASDRLKGFARLEISSALVASFTGEKYCLSEPRVRWFDRKYKTSASMHVRRLQTSPGLSANKFVSVVNVIRIAHGNYLRLVS